MKRTMDTEELLAFADEAEQPGTTYIQQENYTGEEAVMSDEDLSGREPLQRVRIVVETDGQSKYFESLFYTAAELEELMSEMEPVFNEHPKQVLSSEEMDEKTKRLNK